MNNPPDPEQCQEIYQVLCDSLLKDGQTTYNLFHSYMEKVCEAQRIICAKEYMKGGTNVAHRIKEAHIPYDLMKLPE